VDETCRGKKENETTKADGKNNNKTKQKRAPSKVVFRFIDFLQQFHHNFLFIDACPPPPFCWEGFSKFISQMFFCF
jgi:hypothetical protein